MARITALLGPLGTLMGREQGRMFQVAGNHFLLFGLLLFAQSPRSAGFLLVLVGLVFFISLSTDPLRRLPQERLLLLPFTAAERVRIRIIGFFFSPVPWVIVLVPIWGGRRNLSVSLTLLLLAVASNGISLYWARRGSSRRPLAVARLIPSLPGPLGGLVKKNLRELFHLLDPWAGLTLALAATVYQCTAPRPDPEAVHGLTLLVVLTLSSAAQRLFALDAKDGWTRYALLPLRGWQVLLAKDVAFLGVLLVLVLPLEPRSGLAAGLVLLAFGHGPSVLDPQPQAPWCFASGARGWSGWIQVLVMFATGIATHRWSPLILVPCLVGYLGSLWYFGTRLEARWRGGRTGRFRHG